MSSASSVVESSFVKLIDASNKRSLAKVFAVNRGEDRATYVMPDLIGLNGERAADVMRYRGFRVSMTFQGAPSAIPPGVVVRQTPAGGFASTLDPTLVASPGGFPLVEGGKIIGAIGCSGATGDQDAVACKAGADTIK